MDPLGQELLNQRRLDLSDPQCLSDLLDPELPNPHLSDLSDLSDLRYQLGRWDLSDLCRWDLSDPLL